MQEEINKRNLHMNSCATLRDGKYLRALSIHIFGYIFLCINLGVTKFCNTIIYKERLHHICPGRYLLFISKNENTNENQMDSNSIVRCGHVF